MRTGLLTLLGTDPSTLIGMVLGVVCLVGGLASRIYDEVRMNRMNR